MHKSIYVDDGSEELILNYFDFICELLSPVHRFSYKFPSNFGQSSTFQDLLEVVKRLIESYFRFASCFFSPKACLLRWRHLNKNSNVLQFFEPA